MYFKLFYDALIVEVEISKPYLTIYALRCVSLMFLVKVQFTVSSINLMILMYLNTLYIAVNNIF